VERDRLAQEDRIAKVALKSVGSTNAFSMACFDAHRLSLQVREIAETSFSTTFTPSPRAKSPFETFAGAGDEWRIAFVLPTERTNSPVAV
jgi:hypothetical protein